MSPSDFSCVIQKVLLLEYEEQKMWLHLNTLKPGPESIKINAVSQPNWLNICQYGF